MSSYTPGPWMYQHHGMEEQRLVGTVRTNPGCICIATITGIDAWTREANDANGKLLAAAPELVDALRFAVLNADKFSECDPDGVKHNWITSARALLARIAA